MDVVQALGALGALSTPAAAVLGWLTLRQRTALRERDRDVEHATAVRLEREARLVSERADETVQIAMARAQDDLVRRAERGELRTDALEGALSHARGEITRMATELIASTRAAAAASDRIRDLEGEARILGERAAALESQNAEQAAEIGRLQREAATWRGRAAAAETERDQYVAAVTSGASAAARLP